MRTIIVTIAVSLLIGGLVLTVGSPAGAWVVPADFITGGGWFIIRATNPDDFHAILGQRANFGWHGGWKNGDWWGNGNYIDHGIGLHVHSLTVNGYIVVRDYDPDKNGHPRGTRDVCGTAKTNNPNFPNPVYYRVRMKDFGEPGRQDQFGISLYATQSGGRLYGAASISFDGVGSLDGGNIQLHRGNKSNLNPPDVSTFCDPDVPGSVPDDFSPWLQ